MAAEPTSDTNADVVSRHIVKTPGVMRGRARVAGTRVRVMDLVAHARACQLTADQLAAEFPALSRADVYAALAYYEDFRSEIEDALVEDRRSRRIFAESIRSRSAT
ncbi:MAG: DUF433 domain-containing protein [Chloroflexi bacterium]|nr:DUF433 domain-containing protein [Chloroflexota bacterium]